MPAVANAATVVSQANGRLVTTSLLGSDVLDSVVALRGADAVNTDASGDVIEDTPLDASAIAELINLQAGPTDLFGDNGIIQLGAVGQYARANDDGSSAAFSGAVSSAPSLIGIDTDDVTGSTIGAPTADSTAEIRLGASSDPVSLGVTVGALAASAQEDTSGTQTGQYDIADLQIVVGGSILEPVLDSLRTPLDVVLAVASGLGVNIANPISSDGTVVLDLQDLLDVAGVTDINDLAPGTNLLTYVPQAVLNTVTDAVDGVLDALSDAAADLGLLGAPLVAAIGVAEAAINPILNGLTGSLSGPLGAAVDELAQLDANVQTNGSDGSFTQTALRLGVGPDGSIASVDLASATVGPNAGPEAVPLVNASSAGIAGIIAVLFLGGWLALRRRSVSAIAA